MERRKKRIIKEELGREKEKEEEQEQEREKKKLIIYVIKGFCGKIYTRV